MPTILIVDDEDTHARALARFLQRRAYSPIVAISAAQARAALAKARPDVVLLDQRLGSADGVAILREIGATDPELPVIIMTAYGSIDMAVAAMKAGARDYIQKPIDLEQLALIVARALEESRTRAVLDRVQGQGAASESHVLGRSAAMQPVHAFLDRMRQIHDLRAGQYPTVLLLGETGTGKSLVARAIHEASAIGRGPFLVLDCTAVPHELMEAELFGFERGAFTDAKAAKPGLLEVAAGGTVFLDEIGELAASAQAKLLRVLEEKTMRRVGGLADITVDVRIVAATNRDPPREVEAGRLRRDLLYRLNVLTLTMPPLRERDDDVLVLARHYMDVYRRKYGRAVQVLAPDAAAALLTDPWIGNVRELSHVIERAVLMVDGDTIEARHLHRTPVDSVPETAPPTRLDAAERLMIEQALDASGGNVSQAARRLGVSRELLRYRLRKHGLR